MLARWSGYPRIATPFVVFRASKVASPCGTTPLCVDEVDAGQHYLPGVATGGRETIVTSAIDAQPQYLLRLPGPSWLPALAGIGTAVFFLSLTVKWWRPRNPGRARHAHQHSQMVVGERSGTHRRLYDIGEGIRVPDYMSGSRSHSWWSMVVLMLVDGSIFASLVFSFFFLWTVAPSGFPPEAFDLPLAPSSWLSCIAWLV